MTEVIVEEKQTPFVSYNCRHSEISGRYIPKRIHNFRADTYKRWARYKSVRHNKLMSQRSPYVLIVDGNDYYKTQFESLKNKWYSEIMFVSNPNIIVENANYKKIIELGINVVPFLVKDMKENNTHWFVALQSILKVNPIKPEHNGFVKMMVNDWAEYLEKSNF